MSNDMTDPNDPSQTDPNSDGDPSGDGENTPTPAVVLPPPQIGLAKQATAVALNADGTHTVTFRLTAQNTGVTDLSQVQVVDDLNATFPLPTSFTVASIAVVHDDGEDNLANASYDGSSDVDLLEGAGTLHPSDVVGIEVRVIVDDHGAGGSFSNSATTTGVDPQTQVRADDVSQDGTDVDPDGDGDPTNDNDPTPIVLPAPSPALSLVKRTTTTEFAATGDVVHYAFTVTNTGDVNLTGVAVHDDMLDGPAACGTTALAPAASTTCTGSHTVTPADVTAGAVVNVATATGTAPSGRTVESLPDSVTVPAAAPAPAPSTTVDGTTTVPVDPPVTVPPDGELPATGSSTTPDLLIGAALLGAGFALALVARRRRRLPLSR
ncbi:MAG: LPXTG cell wall anchor domain-containing protein [Ilumatobacteraceae bacterium]